MPGSGSPTLPQPNPPGLNSISAGKASQFMTLPPEAACEARTVGDPVEPFRSTSDLYTNKPMKLRTLVSALRRWPSTLKFKIVAMAVASGVLAAAATTHIVLQRTQAAIEQLLLASASADQEQTAALLGSKLELMQRTLVGVARAAAPALWSDAGAMHRFLSSQAALPSMFDSVHAVARDGSSLAQVGQDDDVGLKPVAVGGPQLLDLGPLLEQALATDQPVVSSPRPARHAPQVLLAVASTPGPGPAPGVLVASLPLHSSGLFSSLSSRRHDGSHRDLVMDRAGTFLAHTDPARILGQAADEPGLAGVFAQWRDSGSPIDTQGSARMTEGHLVSLAGIPGQDWVLVRLTPQSLAMAPLASARGAALHAAAAVGLAAAVLSGLLAWLLTRPISALRSRAEALLDDAAPDLRPWPAGQGEIADLSRAFQHVLEQGRRRQARIEGLVLELEAVLDHAGVGIAVSRNSRYELVSRHFCEMFRCERKQALGQLTRSFYASQTSYQELSDLARPALTLHGAFDGEAELARRDGHRFWAHLRACAVVPGDPSKGTIWIIEDVTEVRAQRERLAHSAHHDSLTGLPNRAAFEQTLGHATAFAAQTPFCALFIDLDRFKQVNDTGGHAAGDALLRAIALCLQAALRRSDSVARLGGDEFAVVLQGCPLERALVIAEKLRAAVADYRLEWNGVSHSVGASLGLVRVDGRYSSIAEVLEDADAACYAAKRAGRNQVAVFERTAAASAPAVPGTPPRPESIEALGTTAADASSTSQMPA